MTMPDPADPLAKARHLNDLRQRVLAGEDIPPEEYREIIADIRQTRLNAAAAPIRPKARTTKLNPDTLEPL